MKKLSLYIFLVLMWCNVGFAQLVDKIIVIKCKPDFYNGHELDSEIHKSEIKKLTFKFKIHIHDEKGVREDSDDKNKKWLGQELANFFRNSKDEMVYQWINYFPIAGLQKFLF